MARPAAAEVRPALRLTCCLLALASSSSAEQELHVTSTAAVTAIEQIKRHAEDPHASERFLPAIVLIRKLLSKANPPIDEILGSGVVPSIVALLEPAHEYEVRTEAAWALTNIGSGTAEHTTYLFDHGAVAPLIAALGEQPTTAALAEAATGGGTAAAAEAGPADDADAESPLQQLRAQAAWAVGNLVADSRANRDVVVAHGGLEAMTDFVRATTGARAMQTATWALANFFRFGSTLEEVRAALPLFARLLFAADAAIVSDAAWALSYISRREEFVSPLLLTLPARTLAFLPGGRGRPRRAPGAPPEPEAAHVALALLRQAEALGMGAEAVAPGAAEQLAEPRLFDEWELPLGAGHAWTTALAPRAASAPAGAAGGAAGGALEQGALEAGARVEARVCGCRMAAWLVQLVGTPPARVPALKVVGNLVAGADAQAQAVVDCGLLARLRPLLEGDDAEVVREVAFATSNLLAGTAEQLAGVLSAGVLPGLFKRLEPAAEGGKAFWPRTNWAAVSIANALLRGTRRHVQMVLALGCDDECA